MGLLRELSEDDPATASRGHHSCPAVAICNDHGPVVVQPDPGDARLGPPGSVRLADPRPHLALAANPHHTQGPVGREAAAFNHMRDDACAILLGGLQARPSSTRAINRESPSDEGKELHTTAVSRPFVVSVCQISSRSGRAAILRAGVQCPDVIRDEV